MVRARFASSAVCAAAALCSCASGGHRDATVDASGTSDAPPTCGEPGQLPCDAIHVATSGNDSFNGTESSPMRTINSAIARAAAMTPPLPVFVRAGTYDEVVVMADGVDVYGGFDETWARNPSVTTTIEGLPAIRFSDLTVATKLDTVTAVGSDGSATGESSVAVVITSSAMVELVDVDVQAGVGAAGMDGSGGGTGATGLAGVVGKPGVERSSGLFCDSNPIPSGGAGGTSTCGRTGGTGGTPGVGGNGGNKGGNGVGGTLGGAGAPGESQNGSVGGTGANGGIGTDGAGGGSIGTFSGELYVPADGEDGGDGTPGNGGGGGGGGGGGTTNCDSTGSSGGGGGAGGCGGGAGTAGHGGGGSFGVIAVDSSVVIRSSTVTADHGGAGGRGGDGGAGGGGGAGGPGGPYGGSAEQDDGGNGAAGGRGGNGGRGGHGGGGGGGPSVALVCVGNTTMMVPQTQLVSGVGGAGGSSSGAAGTDGTASNAAGCSLF